MDCMTLNFLLKPLVLMLIVITVSFADEEVDAAAKCDATYTACMEKCDQAGDGSSECYTACEDAYSKCLTLAQEQEQ